MKPNVAVVFWYGEVRRADACVVGVVDQDWGAWTWTWRRRDRRKGQAAAKRGKERHKEGQTVRTRTCRSAMGRGTRKKGSRSEEKGSRPCRHKSVSKARGCDKVQVSLGVGPDL
jgi:hypothetical protein